MPCKRLLGQLRLASCQGPAECTALLPSTSASAGVQERTIRKGAVQRVAAAAKRSSVSPDLRDRARRPQRQDQGKPQHPAEGHRQSGNAREGDWRQPAPAQRLLEEQQAAEAQSHSRPPLGRTGAPGGDQHVSRQRRQPQPAQQAAKSPWQAARDPGRAADRQPLALRPQRHAPEQSPGQTANTWADWDAPTTGLALRAQDSWQQQQQQQTASPPWPQQRPAFEPRQARQRTQQQSSGFDADSFVRQQLSGSLPAATTFFVTCHPGLEACVEQELCHPRIGATRVVAARAGVYFRCAPLCYSFC